MQTVLSIVLFIISLIINLILLPFRLIYLFVRKLLGKPLGTPVDEPLAPNTRRIEYSATPVDDGDVSLNINLDQFDQDEQPGIHDAIVEQSDMERFWGSVKHAYDAKKVAELSICPRCKTHTQPMYANFVYATDSETRAMMAPSGYFCQECPTVIIDQELIRAGVSKGYEYRGVLGIDYGKRKHPDYFETWNGKKTIYLLDEEEGTIELTTVDRPPQPLQTRQHLRKKHDKKYKREKLAKKTRKKNRRRKK